MPLFLRNLIFTILQPGIVAGLVPYLILKNREKLFTFPFQFYHYAGAVSGIAGFIIMLHCITRFAAEGRGTLSPVDPTKHLVVTGLYRFTRNPMYIGVMLILAGETVFFLSPPLLIYSLIVFLLFNAFILLHEEPRLKKDFGDEYATYYKKTKRWI